MRTSVCHGAGVAPHREAPAKNDVHLSTDGALAGEVGPGRDLDLLGTVGEISEHRPGEGGKQRNPLQFCDPLFLIGQTQFDISLRLRRRS